MQITDRAFLNATPRLSVNVDVKRGNLCVDVYSPINSVLHEFYDIIIVRFLINL